jgi:hypothetical protein
MNKILETRKATAKDDPVFAAIAEHKALLKEYVRCRNNSERARDQAEKKRGRSLKGKALFTAAAEDTKLEYDPILPRRACRGQGGYAHGPDDPDNAGRRRRPDYPHAARDGLGGKLAAGLGDDRTHDGRRRTYPNGGRMTLRLRYLTLKIRALCWVLRRLRAGQSRITT